MAPSGSAERGGAGVDRRAGAVCRPRNPKRGRRVTLDIRTAGATAGSRAVAVRAPADHEQE
ncbi:hypothetical protein EAD98_27465 [Micromonospora sp. CV4]|nr:hypothetical protein EAD98_27465 [Micromonospora sp. CV4]